MKKLVKDIGMFGLGSIALGGFSVAAGSMGQAGGLSAMGNIMPVIGQTVMLKHTVKPLFGLTKKIKKM